MQKTEANGPDLKWVTSLLSCALVIFHLGLAAAGYRLSRDQHLGTAVEYAKGSIDFLRPIIIGANANNAPTPLEFPLWQALTALLMKGFGQWYGWGNVVSLAFHLSAMWPLFQLGRHLFSVRAAWWTIVFYLAQPLTWMWGGMAGTDSMAASFAVWFVWLCFRMLETGLWIQWPVTALVGSLSATTKAPFFMVAGLALFFWLLARHRRSSKAWMQLASVGLFSCLAFVLWNGHANRCYAAAEFSYGDLGFRLDSPIWGWWFGDLASRFHLFDWARGAWRASTILLGSLGLALLPLAGFWLSGTAFVRFWIVAGLCCVAVFTHVVLIHWHYYFIFSGPMALLCARAVAEFEPAIRERLRPNAWVRVGGVLLVAGLCIAQGLQAVHLKIYLDPYADECARQIREHTAPGDKLIVWGGEWTGPLLRAERQGVCTSDMTLITDPGKLHRLKELGYTKVVFVNPSPLLVAVTTASRSGLYYTRDLLKLVPVEAKEWRVVFNSSAALILEIPR